MKEPSVFERIGKLRTVVFEKTGTVTVGEYEVTDIIPVEGTEEEVLQRAASVNYFSSDVLADGLVKSAKQRKLQALPAEKFERVPGKGVQAVINGMKVSVGSYEFLRDAGIPVGVSVKARAVELAKEGKVILFVISGRVFSGIIALYDSPRPEAKEAIMLLKELGILPVLLSGDSEEATKRLADELSVETYVPKVTLEKRISKIKDLQETGRLVGFVQNSPEVSIFGTADISILMGGTSGASTEKSLVIGDDPREIAYVITRARSAEKTFVKKLIGFLSYSK